MKRDLSTAVAESWEDPEVAAKRAAHHGLMVDGQIYSSTYQAMKALRIGSGTQHIKWRTEFKDLVNRNVGVLVTDYPMLDGSHRDVMLTEPGAKSAVVLQTCTYADLASGKISLPNALVQA